MIDVPIKPNLGNEMQRKVQSIERAIALGERAAEILARYAFSPVRIFPKFIDFYEFYSVQQEQITPERHPWRFENRDIDLPAPMHSKVTFRRSYKQRARRGK
jgi:hypothetical protein